MKSSESISATLSALIFTSVIGSPLAEAGCTAARRVDGVKQLVKTIRTHSFADAAQIPLAPACNRVVIVYPSELGGNVPIPVPAGVDALTVRTVLAGGGQALFAGVKDPKYTVNQNGSVTFDLIQTDITALPCTQFREIHEYDLSTCQITSILGYGFGDLLPETILSK